MGKTNHTYHEPGLVDVLGLPVGVLDLLAEDQVKLEEEDVPLLGLADDDVLGVPDLEAGLVTNSILFC